MGIGFSSPRGGTTNNDYAIPTYNLRPGPFGVGVFIYDWASGPVLTYNAGGKFVLRFAYQATPSHSLYMERGYSGGTHVSQSDGRATAGDAWQFWFVWHDGDPTHNSEFSIPAGALVDVTGGTTPTTGTLLNTEGELAIGFNSTDGLTPQIFIAEMFFVTTQPSSGELAGTRALTLNPMDYASPPVWYHRMRTLAEVNDLDAQVGDLTSPAGDWTSTGPRYWDGYNPGLADPSEGGANPVPIIMHYRGQMEA